MFRIFWRWVLAIDRDRVGYPAGGTGGLYRWMPACGGRCFFLGSFGENPEVSPGAPGQNSLRQSSGQAGEGGAGLARVLSDGGWMDTVCNSPCFWCCFIPNYATHYTTVGAKKQAFSGLNEDLVVSPPWGIQSTILPEFPCP